jgi:hypothetical protein
MWKSNDIKKLIELYPDNSNIEIGIILNRSKSSIENKSFRLGLKKSDDFIKKRNELAHKARIENGGRDLTENELIKISKKYKTKMDLIKNDEPAYQAIIRNGLLDKACGHMSVIKYSTPQLILQYILDKLLSCNSKYNDRSVLKPYELDIYYSYYRLGFEYQGLYWHTIKNNDTLKLILCKKNNIELIHIYELTRNYENDIKGQLINNLDLINKRTKNNFIEADINRINVDMDEIYAKLYNSDELIELAKGYDSFYEFKTNHPKEYKKLLKLKLIDISTKHMKDKRKKTTLSVVDIVNIIDKYDNLTEFRKNEIKLYKHLKRNGKDHLITHLKRM